MCVVYFILGVAVFDVYCTVLHAPEMVVGEENPIAGLLIRDRSDSVMVYVSPNGLKNSLMVSTVDVSLLVLFKVVGLLGAQIIFNWVLQRAKFKTAVAIIAPMAVFQIALLLRLLQ